MSDLVRSNRVGGEYGNLINDYMFKRVFGREESKDILITFLKHIVGDEGIEDVTFVNVEHLGATKEDRKVIFDVCVLTDKGDEYIVEMQLARQKYFIDRAMYYLSYPIQKQGGEAKAKYYGERQGAVYLPGTWAVQQGRGRTGYVV